MVRAVENGRIRWISRGRKCRSVGAHPDVPAAWRTLWWSSRISAWENRLAVDGVRVDALPVYRPAAGWIFRGGMLLEFPPLTAAAAAMLAPLISTDAWYGLDYSSYVLDGRGLFPQSVAAILLL